MSINTGGDWKQELKSQTLKSIGIYAGTTLCLLTVAGCGEDIKADVFLGQFFCGHTLGKGVAFLDFPVVHPASTFTFLKSAHMQTRLSRFSPVLATVFHKAIISE